MRIIVDFSDRLDLREEVREALVDAEVPFLREEEWLEFFLVDGELDEVQRLLADFEGVAVFQDQVLFFMD